MNLDELRSASFRFDEGFAASGLRVVPEPVVKRWIAEVAGPALPVPAGVVLDGEASLSGLAEPLVLKAFGPGLVHKSDVGAVVLNLAAADVEPAVQRMRDALAGHGIKPAGFLVEEQHSGGVELIIGVVVHPLVGALALLGHGGTFAEFAGKPVMRPWPITARDADEMVAELGAQQLLDGVRGGQPVDRSAISAAVHAVARLAERVGYDLAEFECNPVIATQSGVVALDARLVFGVAARDSLDSRTADFERLFAPRSIAVAGASATKVTFGNRFLAAYRAAGWTDGLYAIHPTAEQIDGVPAVASVAEIPGGVDYLLAGIPAAACADLVRQAAGSVPFVHVVSGGFGETGEGGASLEQELLQAARESGVRLLGPNCMGIYSPRGRQTFQAGAPGIAGVVSVLSQSGGLTGDVLQAGHRAGLGFAHLASIGNAVDVNAAELLDWLIDDPQTQVIGLYLEGLGGGRNLVRALRRADGRKPVVLLVGGTSTQGSRAVASHTGALATDAAIWKAIADGSGVTQVTSLEDLIGCLAYLQRWAAEPVASEPSVLVIGPGGGASVLTTDACDRAGLRLGDVSASAQEALRGLGYGAGTSLANPVEIPLGPASASDGFARVLEPILAGHTFSDILLHINVAAYYGYGPANLQSLADLVGRTGCINLGKSRLALVLRNAEVARGEDADLVAAACHDARIPTFTTPDAAARAIASMQRFCAHWKDRKEHS